MRFAVVYGFKAGLLSWKTISLERAPQAAQLHQPMVFHTQGSMDAIWSTPIVTHEVTLQFFLQIIAV